MMSKTLRSTLILTLSVSTLLLVSGCFDYEEHVSLSSDGSGKVVYKTIFDAEGMPEGGEMEMQETVAEAPEVKRDQYRQNGKLIEEETASFSNLSELQLYDRTYRVETLPQNGNYRFSGSYSFVTPGSEKGDASADDPMASMADAGVAMFGQMFEGKTFNLLVELPGMISKAEPAMVGGKEFPPETGDSWVSYKIPMKAFFTSINPEDMKVVIDFEGDFPLETGSVETVRVERPEEETTNLSGFTSPAMMPGQPMEPMQPYQPMDTEPSGEEKAYAEQIIVRNVEVDQMMKPAEVSGEIKNPGGRNLREVTLIVYALDKVGQPIYEIKKNVVNTDMGDAPMRQNYSKRFRINLEDVASDWSGGVRVEVDSVRFDY